MSEKSERAIMYSENSFNCAQAVFAAFAEDYDIDEKTALRVAGGFGGGLRRGEICGAASGGAMVIGAAKGHTTPGDLGAKRDCGARVSAFMAEFEAINGCLTCRGLLGVDVSTPEGAEAFARERMAQTKCRGFIAGAAELLERLGY
ncbi:MAG: C-GCAxxG-C-C family protein [Oscillospiraceae bacterium]|jgi:C_GCAxxG_C_C family probable redox protein|nr:C-GCAxxG-C-C family protein [Oscillospiraceae bacterium]